jgi:hypothetical protein
LPGLLGHGYCGNFHCDSCCFISMPPPNAVHNMSHVSEAEKIVETKLEI